MDVKAKTRTRARALATGALVACMGLSQMGVAAAVTPSDDLVRSWSVPAGRDWSWQESKRWVERGMIGMVALIISQSGGEHAMNGVVGMMMLSDERVLWARGHHQACLGDLPGRYDNIMQEAQMGWTAYVMLGNEEVMLNRMAGLQDEANALATEIGATGEGSCQ